MGGNYNRTKCPICGDQFQYREGGGYHYKQVHPEYAKWTNRWVKILALAWVPPLVALLLIGDFLLPSLSQNTIFQGIAVSYFFGSIILMLVYRFRAERGFRNSWRQEHPNSSLA
jgi:hypothetical protein